MIKSVENNKRNARQKEEETNELARKRGKNENPIKPKRTNKNDEEIKVKKEEILIKCKPKDVKSNKSIEPTIPNEEKKEKKINTRRLGLNVNKANTLIIKEEPNQNQSITRNKSLKHDKGGIVSKSNENINGNINFRTRLNKQKIQINTIKKEVKKERKEKNQERKTDRTKRSLSLNNEKQITKVTKPKNSTPIKRNFRMTKSPIKNQINKSAIKESKVIN